MKKIYTTPMSELIALSSRDVITLSVEGNDEKEKLKSVHLSDILGGAPEIE